MLDLVEFLRQAILYELLLPILPLFPQLLLKERLLPVDLAQAVAHAGYVLLQLLNRKIQFLGRFGLLVRRWFVRLLCRRLICLFLLFGFRLLPFVRGISGFLLHRNLVEIGFGCFVYCHFLESHKSSLRVILLAYRPGLLF